MSEMRFTTDETVEGVCDICGKKVTRVKVLSAYSDDILWRSTQHEAPCGVPCLGGGVRGKAIKAGYHGQKGGCPKGCEPSQ